jgi:hypothetical protein
MRPLWETMLRRWLGRPSLQTADGNRLRFPWMDPPAPAVAFAVRRAAATGSPDRPGGAPAAECSEKEKVAG